MSGSAGPCNVPGCPGVQRRVRPTQLDRSGSYADLVAAHATALLRLALMLTGDPADAEDLLQATLLRATRHAQRVSVMEAPAAYLRQIMLNEHSSWGRRLRRRVRTVSDQMIPTDAAVPAQTDVVDQREVTWQWLATLPRGQRTVLVLRFYEDLPYAEIAALLGCSQGTARSQVSRGLSSLRARLTDLEEK